MKMRCRAISSSRTSDDAESLDRSGPDQVFGARAVARHQVGTYHIKQQVRITRAPDTSRNRPGAGRGVDGGLLRFEFNAQYRRTVG